MDVSFDIAIAGAGPAGTAAALALKGSGLKVALVDKAVFPRHKTCGDAIPGPTIKMLKQLIPGFSDELAALKKKQYIRHCKIIAPNAKAIEISWKAEAYNCKREHFDDFLLTLVKSHTNTKVFEGFEIKGAEFENNAWKITGKGTNNTLQAKLLIGCDGANSIIAHHVAGRQIDRERHCTAVAAYYKGVDCPAETNVFLLAKNYLPGYFWVFPVGGGIYNAGFGIVSSAAAKHTLKLREVLAELIKTEPALQPMFAGAKQVSDVKGFGLPIGGRKTAISGHHYMLCGDAASLIDPLQGHGIDKAAYSGIAAARQAISCFEQNRWDADFLKNYDRKVYGRYGAELARNYRIMKLLYNKPQLINTITSLAANKLVKKAVLKYF